MIIATQYATIQLAYEYSIVHPCDSSIRIIGSDNASDGVRVLRVASSNTTNVQLKLYFGNRFAGGMTKTYSAAFGIVNEENYTINITHINVTSLNHTYLKIYLHGNRSANANNLTQDPTGVFMWNNNTVVNESNTTAWKLAAGDDNSTNMCYNTSNRAATTIKTPWDKTAHVRYSRNDSNASSGISDFVWVQIILDIPTQVDAIGPHTGTIWIHMEAED